MSQPNFTFLSRDKYYADMLSRIRSAGEGDRVTLVTMAFDPTKSDIGQIMTELGAAARRGADVLLTVDAYVFLGKDGRVPGPLFFTARLPARMPGSFGAAKRALDELEAAGGRYAIINQPGRPFTSPIGGRSHIKFSLINDRVYVGGCNLNTNTHHDLMVGWDDPKIARYLGSLADKMVAMKSARVALDSTDTTLPVSAGASLLVDAGVPGQSLIFDRALALIDEAQERIFLTCQYFPNDVTAKRLLAAHQRGVKVEIYYNPPGQHVWPHNVLHHGVVAAERLRLPASFFEHVLVPGQSYLHAKVLVSERAAMVGSHNYISAGVRLGTAEIALVSEAPEFRREARAVMLAILGQ